MLETVSDRLSERGGPHFGSPDKRPAARLETIRLAGELRIPFTTGILIGIGETRAERIEALEAIAALHREHGHVQEVIVQNFRAKPGTKMADHPEPALDELLWTAAVARLRPAAGRPRPGAAEPQLRRLPAPARRRDRRLGRCLAGDDRPRQPGGAVARDRAAAGRDRGGAGWRSLRACPSTRSSSSGLWLAPRVLTQALRSSDGDGLAREDGWFAGAQTPVPFVPRDALPLDTADELGEDEIARLFAVRGEELHRVLAAADRSAPRGERRRGQLRRHAERQLHERLLLPVRLLRVLEGEAGREPARARLRRADRGIVRRAGEAWERGAVEICLQGGIHPGFDGDYYVEVCEAIKREPYPDLHVHAFSALEVWQGAATLGEPLDRVPRPPARRRPGLAAGNSGRDPRRRGSCGALPGQGEHGAVARGARDRAPGGSALDGDDHVRARGHAEQLGAAPAARPRAPAAHRRVHRARAAAVRAHGGADLPEGPGALRADVPGSAADARRRPAGAASAHHQHPGVVGEAGSRRSASLPALRA